MLGIRDWFVSINYLEIDLVSIKSGLNIEQNVFNDQSLNEISAVKI